MRLFKFITFVTLIIFSISGAEDLKDVVRPKVLHLSFHLGCIKEIEEVARELKLELTSWYVLGTEQSRKQFDVQARGNSIYNISHQRAERVWSQNKDYFNEFDVILTSDTAPLSRIFLQNRWKKPLIIWVCNRFDYFDGASLDSPFPDAEYYDLFRKAGQLPNVRIVGYTPYEKFYAARRNIDIGNLLIKPLGTVRPEMWSGKTSAIPANIKKEETFFIPPRYTEEQVRFLRHQCEDLEIKTYSGPYNGPYDLKGFRGVIQFPYAWSNLALFENAQLGLVHFVPSIAFVLELSRQLMPIRTFTSSNFGLSEWYHPDNSEIIIYFDSWQDLKQKVESFDFKKMSVQVINFGIKHRNEMLRRWIELLLSFGIHF